jgi:hypothetical protein
MKRLVTAVFASLLLVTSPVWAGGGHGKHDDKHAEKEWKKERKAWDKYEKHRDKYARRYDERPVVQNYYYPAPRVVEHRYYVDAVPYSPPAGIYVNTPNIYIPWSY